MYEIINIREYCSPIIVLEGMNECAPGRFYIRHKKQDIPLVNLKRLIENEGACGFYNRKGWTEISTAGGVDGMYINFRLGKMHNQRRNLTCHSCAILCNATGS